jgi:hypothetical protein
MVTAVGVVGIMVTVALPVILETQPAADVATTLYVPAAV